MRGFTPCGDKIEPVYGYYVDANGVKQFGEIGHTNNYEKIQSAVKGSTLYEMIDKYQKTGDDTFLRAKAQGFYADVTNVPKNMYEVKRIKANALNEFNQYPVEFRALFNHNVDEYFNSVVDGTIKDKFNTYFNKNKIEVKTEVKIDEQQTSK